MSFTDVKDDVKKSAELTSRRGMSKKGKVVSGCLIGLLALVPVVATVQQKSFEKSISSSKDLKQEELKDFLEKNNLKIAMVQDISKDTKTLSFKTKEEAERYIANLEKQLSKVEIDKNSSIVKPLAIGVDVSTFTVGLGQKINVYTQYDYQYDANLRHNYFNAINSVSSNLSGFTMGTVSWNQTSHSSNIGSNIDFPSFGISVTGTYTANMFIQGVGTVYTSKPYTYATTKYFRP